MKAIIEQGQSHKMTRYYFILISLFFVSLYKGNGTSINTLLPSPHSDYVIILNPDAETCAWSAMYITKIQENLNQKYPNLPVYAEHMLALSITSEESLSKYKTDLFSKYPTPPKYIILLETDMFGLMHEEIEKNWGKNIPTLLLARNSYFGPPANYINKWDIENKDRTSLIPFIESHDNLYVIHNPFHMEETLSLMKQMLPQFKKLLFITDERYISAQNRSDLNDIITRNHPEIEIEHIISNTISTDRLVQNLSQVPKDTGVLFFAWFNEQKQSSLDESDIFLQTNVYRIFNLYANSPIFTLNDIGVIESGMIGGYYTRFDQVMETIFQTFDNMVQNVASREMIELPKPIPTFNYIPLLEHGLLSAIPNHSHVYYRPHSFWEKNKKLIIGITFAILLLSFLTRYFFTKKTNTLEKHQKKLKASYSDIINNMPIGYRQEKLIFNEAGESVDFVITAVNPSYEKQLTPREEIVGKKGSETNPEMFAEMLNIYRTILQDKSKKVSMAYYFKETNRYFSVIISPSSEESFLDLFYVDTTELYKTQQMLRTVNNKLTMSLDVANITPWKWDLEKKIILCDVNKPIELYAEGMKEEEQSSIPERHYLSRIFKEDLNAVQEIFQKVLSGEIHTVKCEYRLYKSSSKTSYDWVEVRGSIDKKGKDGKVLSLLGTSLIITDRKNIESELLQAKEKAEESNRLKSAFLANMSHEIRTPLNAIVGFSNILAATEKEEDKQEYISIIENNNALLLQLVNDILDLSKIEAGTMEFNYSDVDLNCMLWDLLEFTQDKAIKGVKVFFDRMIPDCFIRTEKKRLLQVMNNLLSNAVKFTAEGEIRFGYYLKDDGKLHFYVSDTGCGISQEQQSKIFGRFVKLNHFVQGTGLGLSLCQMIIQHMGGEIHLESKEGAGTTFWFSIPYMSVNKEDSIKEEKYKNTEKNRLKVLIAEDNQSNFELFDAVLRNDYQIIHAWNGKEAIEMFKEYQPNIVLMDINMPKMNGYEATIELRKLSTDVPIIAVTAYAFSTDEMQIKRNGFNGYSPKPLNVQKLRTQMTELLVEKESNN